MTRQALLTSSMLFVAAAGWVHCPPPLAGEGRTMQALMSPGAATRLRERTIPLGCAVLGLAILAAGLLRRIEPESTHERQ